LFAVGVRQAPNFSGIKKAARNIVRAARKIFSDGPNPVSAGKRCGNSPYLVSMPGVGPAPFFITQHMASSLPQALQV
jgi:hypothetical protein